MAETPGSRPERPLRAQPLAGATSTLDRVAPVAALGQPVTYELGTGQLTIDTTKTATLSQPLEIRAEVGVGRIVVEVPKDAIVQTHAVAGGGHTLVFGDRKVGPGVDETFEQPPLSNKVIRLDLRVGLGSVEVRRG